jgi:hypothetical protein
LPLNGVVIADLDAHRAESVKKLLIDPPSAFRSNFQVMRSKMETLTAILQAREAKFPLFEEETEKRERERERERDRGRRLAS